MKKFAQHLVRVVASATMLSGCAPVAVQPPAPQEEREALDRERYQAQIRFDPAVPQAITGFLRLGRTHSSTLGSAAVLDQIGNPRDLDMLIDALNDLTELRAEFTPDLPYSDPRLFDLPIIIPQGLPNEVELEQLSRYLREGGFVLDTGLGFDTYREGLEKYGGLVWGRDARVERLAEDHPLFRSYFDLSEGMTLQEQRIQGLFIGERLAVVGFAVLGSREEERVSGPTPPPQPLTRGAVGAISPSARTLEAELTRELTQAQSRPLDDLRFRQRAVNVVVYALTQEGSIVRRSAAPD